jgi:hypothetical protein
MKVTAVGYLYVVPSLDLVRKYFGVVDGNMYGRPSGSRVFNSRIRVRSMEGDRD